MQLPEPVPFPIAQEPSARSVWVSSNCPATVRSSALTRPVVRSVTLPAMKPKTIYLALSFVGVLLPYWQFVPWVMQHGMNLSLFVRELFANRIAAFFGMDVVASAVVLIVFMRIESARLTIRWRWLPVLALLLVGVSLALPMFLYMREVKLEQPKA